MISDGKYEEFECALSNDKHFLSEPILFTTCGHCACRACLQLNNNAIITCKICGEITEKKLLSDRECIPIKKALKRSLEDLAEIVDKKIKQSLNHMINALETDEERINIKIEYIKEEIEIRIESLKIELDELHDKFKKEVECYRSQIINTSKIHKKQYEDKKHELEEKYRHLQDDIKQSARDSDELLYKNQSYLQELNKVLEKINEQNFMTRFEVSKDKIPTKMIGNLFLQNEFSSEELRNILNNYQKIEYTELQVNPNDICVLPTGYVLLSNTDQKNLTVFDKNFNLLLTIGLIAGKPIRPSRVTCNNEDRIYITDLSENQVIMIDFEFKHIKSVGRKGDRADQFDLINGIQYFMNRVFVCDSENKRIQVLSDNLEFERPIVLDYKPWLIRISKEKVVCVSRYDKMGIFFYDVDSFALITSYSTHGFGRISEINSYFYETCYNGSKIYCYDKRGIIVEEIDITKLKGFIDASADGALTVFENTLIIASNSQKKLLKLIKK